MAAWKWRNDRRSERNLCNYVKKPKKNSELQRGLNPWPLDYRIAITDYFIIFISFPQFIYDLFHISLTLISFALPADPMHGAKT